MGVGIFRIGLNRPDLGYWRLTLTDHVLSFYFYFTKKIGSYLVIKLGIPIYFIDHSEFITVQCKKILSRANHYEIKCSEFGSIKRTLRPHLRTIIAG